jgi:hypothetical protein
MIKDVISRLGQRFWPLIPAGQKSAGGQLSSKIMWFRNTGNRLVRLFKTNVLQAVLPKGFWNN